MKDKKTVSNDYYELKAVAKYMGVPVSHVMIAKEITGSNLRCKLEKWIAENEIIVTIEKC
jgi:predicted RecB family nuclease